MAFTKPKEWAPWCLRSSAWNGPGCVAAAGSSQPESARGYAAPEEQVVCLRCLANLSATSAGDGPPRRVAGVAAPLNPWMAQEAVIVATLDALRGDWPPEPASADAVLHVPAEWSAATSSLLALVDQAAPSPGPAPAPTETRPADAPLVAAVQPAQATTAVDGGLAPEPSVPAAAATGTRRSRHEAEPVENRRMPAQAPRRRAGLFTRLLTVRSFPRAGPGEIGRQTRCGSGRPARRRARTRACSRCTTDRCRAAADAWSTSPLGPAASTSST